LRVPKCAEVKILSWADFSVISRADGDRELRFLVPDRGGAPAVPGLAPATHQLVRDVLGEVGGLSPGLKATTIIRSSRTSPATVVDGPNQIGRPYVMACRPPTFTSFKSFIAGS
jgi:hypothetical protein